jgi:DNA-binding protein H-NS
MKFNLNSMTKKQLEKLRTDVDKALERLKSNDLNAARQAAEKAASAFGFSLSDLAGAPAKPARGRKPAAAAGSKVAPKYRNPENADETWTGRGRPPRWVLDAEAAGKSRAELLI